MGVRLSGFEASDSKEHELKPVLRVTALELVPPYSLRVRFNSRGPWTSS
jgi:hypothetical protein